MDATKTHGGGSPGNNPEAQRMAKLIGDQHALCTELESLSRSQSAMVEGGDTDGVLEVLGRRQRIIDRMTELNESLAPMRERREQMLAQLASSDRERVRTNINEINELVERVRERDEQDREAMERRRGSIATEISGLARGRGAVAAYAGTRAPEGPRFQDRKG